MIFYRKFNFYDSEELYTEISTILLDLAALEAARPAWHGFAELI